MNPNDELTSVAMQIILNAGDARNSIDAAFAKALTGDFPEASVLINQSEAQILKAHQSQTKIIQSNAAGDEYELSLLFIHAQDTLMTIITEINLTKRLILVMEKQRSL